MSNDIFIGYGNAGKYLHKDVKTSNDYGDVKCLVELRNLQRQAQTAYERERRMSQQIKPKDELFYWTEVLIIVKKMKSAIENFSGLPQEEARLFMNFLLLLIFTTCNPGRNLDFVKLILWDCRRKSKHMTMEENNYLCLESDGTVKFIFCNYKTSSTYGSQVIDVTNIGYLVSNITRYVDKHRQRLLSGNTHEFLFVQKDAPRSEEHLQMEMAASQDLFSASSLVDDAGAKENDFHLYLSQTQPDKDKVSADKDKVSADKDKVSADKDKVSEEGCDLVRSIVRIITTTRVVETVTRTFVQEYRSFDDTLLKEISYDEKEC
eukprot:gene21130-23205_t